VRQPPHHGPAPVANRFTATESLTKKACNRLLQQNRPKADIGRPFRRIGSPAGSACHFFIIIVIRHESTAATLGIAAHRQYPFQ
jgi:hypothetical protein